MTNESFSTAQNIVLQLVGHNLFSLPFSPDPDTDWKEVLQESRAQTVGMLAFQNYRELPLDDEIAADINKIIRLNTMNSIKCFQYHSYLHKLMVKNDIRYCVLKGAASAHYYPEPLLRTMGDVDFYVHPDDIERALDVLTGEGFVRKDTNHPSHIVLKNEKKHFEMHFKPVGYHEGELGAIYEDCWKDIREKSVLYESDFATFYGPSAFHHGFILLTHLHSHLVSEGVGLRHLCDWLVFANSFSDEEFREIFERKFKKIGIWKLAQILSLASVRYLGMPYKAWMGDDNDTADALMKDILYGGNFGRKDKQRVYEGMFISGAKTPNVKENRLKNVFSSLNSIVDSHWNFAKKCPIVYPFGWIYFSLKFLFRVMLGKRKMNIVDTYKKSNARADVYESLNLFIPEE